MRKTMRFAVLVASATMLTAAITPAAFGAQTSAPPAKAKHCHILLSAEQDDDGISKVLAESCSTVSDAAAKQAFNKMTVQDEGQPFAVASSTALMVWWQSTTGSSGFGSSTVIYGSSGTCDSTGYGVAPNTYWQTNMSAVVGLLNCNAVRFQDRGRNNQSAAMWSPVWAMGFFNDNVGRVQIWSAS